MLRAQDVAKILDVSVAFVYRHKYALGAVHVGSAVRFFDNFINDIKEGRHALPNANK